MPIQDIIRNAYESNALDAKQAIYNALSERAMEVLDIKKTEIATNLFNTQNESIDDAVEELDEGKVHPADAHRILKQTGGVDANHFSIGIDNISKRMELAKEHGYVAKGDSATGRSKAYRTSLHLQRQAAKYKSNNESVEELDEEQLNELSKKTLGNYIKKASYDVGMSGFKQGKAIGNAGTYHKKPDSTTAKEMANRSEKREKGIDRAVNKLTKEEYETILEGVSSEAHELLMHGDNDHHLYKSSYVPVAKKLEKKFKKGTYDHEKAKKLWKYHADRVADSYAETHGTAGQKGHHIFSPAHRREAAAAWADTHHAEMKLGNFREH